MLKNYFKTALKTLWRNKLFFLINIFGLSLGLACCMLILLYTGDEVSFDRFHKKADQIFRIVQATTNPDGSVQKDGSTGMMQGPNFKNTVPEIEDFVRVQSGNLTLRHKGEVFDQENLFVDDNFFSIFSFPFLSGNPLTALASPRSVILSEEIAEKYFGTTNAVGKVLEIKKDKQFEPFIVSGVIKKSPQNSSIKIKILLPLKSGFTDIADNYWTNSYLNTFLRLKPGSDIHAIERKCNIIFNQLAAGELKLMSDKYGMKGKIRYVLQPLADMHLSTEYRADNGLTDGSNPMYSYILSGIAIFILLIACINFINLTVARSVKRAKEIGIRKVVGGQRRQLIGQFLGESYFISCIAFLFAILLVEILLPSFNTLSNKALSFTYLLNYKLVAFYLGLFLVTGFLAGFYPALVLSGFDPVQTLYGRQRFTGKNYLSKGLVILQFTLATFMIIATITIYSQFDYLLHYELGYNDKNLAVVNVGSIHREQLDLFKNELAKNPSIKMVTSDQGGNWGSIARVNNGQQIEFNIKHIDEDYLPLFELSLVKGRNFSKALVSDSAQSVLVNEAFASEAGWKSAIGQTVDFFYRDRKFKVIGLVKDYHYQPLTQKIRPELFNMEKDYPYGEVFIKLKAGSVSAALDHIQQSFKSMFPFQPYRYEFKDAENAQQYESEAKWKQIISLAAVLTILISCIGLFGLASLSALRRTKEIGIRKVLGAPVALIVKNLSNDFLKLVILSALIASPLAWWALQQWLDNYPYHIAMKAWIFVLATLVIVAIAMITVGYQSIKAAVANPVKSLRAQ
jgi:putative ABC transport system permease protein